MGPLAKLGVLGWCWGDFGVKKERHSWVVEVTRVGMGCGGARVTRDLA